MYKSLRSTVNSSEWVFPASGSRRHELLQRSGGCMINSLNFTSSYSTWCNRWAHFKRYGRSRKALQAQVNWEGFERETMLFKHIPQYKVTSDGNGNSALWYIADLYCDIQYVGELGARFFFFLSGSEYSGHQVAQDKNWPDMRVGHNSAHGRSWKCIHTEALPSASDHDWRSTINDIKSHFSPSHNCLITIN